MWNKPPENLSLPYQGVHLWRCALDVETAVVTHLWPILNAEEQQRADRFHFEMHRRRFIVARATLKILIGQYLNLAATSVKFIMGDRGKPSLDPAIAASGLQFNLSHSHEQALYGFALGHQIGVDLEYLRPVEDAATLAQRFFCPREYQAIADLPINQQAKAFLQIWTAKEAFLKGMGSGISGGLDHVEIIPLSPHSLALNFPDPRDQPIADWQLFPIDFGDEYLATVATEAPSRLLQTWQINSFRLNIRCTPETISLTYDPNQQF